MLRLVNVCFYAKGYISINIKVNIETPIAQIPEYGIHCYLAVES